MAQEKVGGVFGGALIVAGTCIGAGMLGLPVVTAAAGLVPTICSFLIVVLIMTFTALCYLEVSLWFKEGTNLITMAEQTLGAWGRYGAWLSYFLLFYSLMSAYTAGGTTMLAHAMDLDVGDSFELLRLSLLFTTPFALVIYFGAYWVDRLNRVLMLGLIIAFFYMCTLFAVQLNADGEILMPNMILVGDKKYYWFTLPLLVTSFGFHAVVPSLKNYLANNLSRLKATIVIGSLIPLGVYLLWVLLIFNLVPAFGDNGLVSMLHASTNPGDLLVKTLSSQQNNIHLPVAFFSFFALTSSFIGVSLGLFDFLSDGFGIEQNSSGRLLLSILTFFPGLAFTFFYPQGFLLALNYAGIFAALLLILYPAIMAWSGRYCLDMLGPFRVFGGKVGLVVAIVFGVAVIVIDILSRVGIVPIPIP